MSVTIINGGTQGLGEAVARKLAADGATGLVLTGRSVDRGEELASTLSAAGTPTIFVESDISAIDAPANIIARCDAEFGVVHGVVNVAAATSRATLFSDTPEHFDHLMNVNVRGPYFLIQAAATLMLRQGVPGSIVNVGSVEAHGGAARLTSYAMSKGALTNMTRNLAFGLMPHRIRVNQVNPGWMETESEHRTQIEQDGAPDDWLVAANASRPWGRLVKPWEVANTIAFCLSDDSGLMTGNWIDMDQSVVGTGGQVIPTADDAIRP